MPLSLFLLGALIGGVVGGYCCYCIGRDKRDELEIDNKLLKQDVKKLRSLLESADRLITTQRQYIDQLENRRSWRKEGSQCDPFTDF